MMNKEPWICPRCTRVNAPWLPYCCSEKQIPASFEVENVMGCQHEFIPSYVKNKEILAKRCKKCGIVIAEKEYYMQNRTDIP